VPIVAPRDAFDDAVRDSPLLSDWFDATWRALQPSLTELANTFHSSVAAYLNDACIFSYPSAAPPTPAGTVVTRKVQIFQAGTLRLQLCAGAEPRDQPGLLRLFDALCGFSQFAFEHTLQIRSLASSMLHEMTLLMTGTGLAVRSLEGALSEIERQFPESQSLVAGARTEHDQIFSQAQLGHYVVRNYLAHTTGDRHNPRRAYTRVDLNDALDELCAIHMRVARGRDIDLESPEGPPLPPVRGDHAELCRALHNVLSNAVKYSYRSHEGMRRSVRIKRISKYDTAGRDCAISVSNYGIGVDLDEVGQVFRVGFRGRRAIAEVATGSGIGLSEVSKIIRGHSGRIKFQSQPLHVDEHGARVYLTTITLVLPRYG
jgi:signal transduction histidine kinase